MTAVPDHSQNEDQGVQAGGGAARKVLVPLVLGQGPAGDGARGRGPVGRADLPLERRPAVVRRRTWRPSLEYVTPTFWLDLPGKDPGH